MTSTSPIGPSLSLQIICNSSQFASVATAASHRSDTRGCMYEVCVTYRLHGVRTECPPGLRLCVSQGLLGNLRPQQPATEHRSSLSALSLSALVWVTGDTKGSCYSRYNVQALLLPDSCYPLVCLFKSILPLWILWIHRISESSASLGSSFNSFV